MIFPELPKRFNQQLIIAQTPPQLNTVEDTGNIQEDKAPLRGITVEEWWQQHGLATDTLGPAARSSREPIDWLARDAWEFYALCVFMVTWIVYWYGSHRGLW
jgi:hypothetical protein